MAAPTLSWTLNTDRGSITFGRVVPFAGNTYTITLSGTVSGQTYTAYVMGDDGSTVVARSSYADGAYSIALNTEALHDSFVREMHEVRIFHCFVRDTEKCVAEGDLPIMWNPLWTDTSTGSVYTMKGPKGDTGAAGAAGATGEQGKSAYEVALANGYVGSQEAWLASLQGPPGETTMAHNETDDLWYGISVGENEYGDKVVKVSQTGEEYSPDASSYVSRTQPQTVAGTKTFTSSPIVPDIGTTTGGTFTRDTDDDSYKTVCTKWLQAWWSAFKAKFVETETHVWNCLQTFKTAPVVKVDAISIGSAPASNTARATAEVQDATGSVLSQDYFEHDTDGSCSNHPGRVKRTVGGVEKVCGVKHTISSAGSRTISLTDADAVLSSTPTAGDNSTKVATTAFVATALGALSVGHRIVKLYRSSVSTTNTTKTIGGLSASTDYKVYVLWATQSSTVTVTVDGSDQPTGIGLNGIGLVKTSDSSGNVTFTIKVSSTSYITRFIALVVYEG